MGEAQGGQLGFRVPLGCGKEILPSIDAEAVEAAEEFLGCAFDDFAES